MRKIRVCCTACIALRGLFLPLAESFTLPSSRTFSFRRIHPLRGRGCCSSRRHEHCLFDNVHDVTRTALCQAYRSHDTGAPARGDIAVLPLGSAQGSDIVEYPCEACVGTENALVSAVLPRSAFRVFLTSVAAVSIFVAVSTSSLWSSPPHPARADTAADSAFEVQVPTQGSYQRDSTSWLPVVSKRRKVSAPPPEIPPGRITLAQWFSRSASKIRVKLSAAAPAERNVKKMTLVRKAEGAAKARRKAFHESGGQEGEGSGGGGSMATSAVSQASAVVCYFVQQQESFSVVLSCHSDCYALLAEY